MAIVTIVGSGMMGSALAFPARENGHTVRLVGTHLDRQIIDTCRATNRHPKFTRDFPEGLEYYQIEELETARKGRIWSSAACPALAWSGSAISFCPGSRKTHRCSPSPRACRTPRTADC